MFTSLLWLMTIRIDSKFKILSKISIYVCIAVGKEFYILLTKLGNIEILLWILQSVINCRIKIYCDLLLD